LILTATNYGEGWIWTDHNHELHYLVFHQIFSTYSKMHQIH